MDQFLVAIVSHFEEFSCYRSLHLKEQTRVHAVSNSCDILIWLEIPLLPWHSPILRRPRGHRGRIWRLIVRLLFPIAHYPDRSEASGGARRAGEMRKELNGQKESRPCSQMDSSSP